MLSGAADPHRIVHCRIYLWLCFLGVVSDEKKSNEKKFEYAKESEQNGQSELDSTSSSVVGATERVQ